MHEEPPLLSVCDPSAPPASPGEALCCGAAAVELTRRATVRAVTAVRRRTERRSIMDGPEERQPADNRFSDARDCAEAIGQVLAASFRGVTLEPLPATQLDLLDALRERERSAIVLRAASKR
jgi:hypothetical protein